MSSSVDLVINSQVFKAPKEILCQKSPYFRQLLQQSVTNVLVIDEPDGESLEMVLKVSLQLKTLDQSLCCYRPTEALFRMTRIAHKYHFFDIESQLSLEMAKRLGALQFETNWSVIIDFYKTSFNDQLNDMPEICLMIVDQNADLFFKVINAPIILKTLSVQVMTDIMSRDTFGVCERRIFSMVHNWTKVNQFDDNLTKIIRFDKLDQIFVKYGCYSCDTFYRQFMQYVTDLKSGESSRPTRRRLSRQTNYTFLINDHKSHAMRVSRKVFPTGQTSAQCIQFKLPVLTVINRIRFKVNIHSNAHSLASVYYYCDVLGYDRQWIRVWECTHRQCFSTQELYITEQTVSAIRMVGITADPNIKFDINFLDDNLIQYGLYSGDKMMDTNHHSIVPTNSDYISKSDAICIIMFTKLKRFYDITDYILKNRCNTSLTIDLNDGLKYGFETHYMIRLTQPVFVNRIYLVFKTSSNETINYWINYSDGREPVGEATNWRHIQSQCGFKGQAILVCFEAKHIVAVRVSGYRLSGRNKLPLHVSQFKIRNQMDDNND